MLNLRKDMDKCTYHDNVHTYREFVKQCMFNVVVFKYHYFSSHVFRIQKTNKIALNACLTIQGLISQNYLKIYHKDIS